MAPGRLGCCCQGCCRRSRSGKFEMTLVVLRADWTDNGLLFEHLHGSHEMELNV